ncbi:MAG: hypothetical protein AAF490_19720 [Chloroflexota bacterium]
MTIHQNQPNWHNPIVHDDFTIYRPFDGRGPNYLLPKQSTIAQREDGSPHFILEMIRHQDVDTSPAYGMLEFSITPDFQLEKATALVRQTLPGATLVPFPFSARGWLRFNSASGLPQSLFKPTMLIWDRLGAVQLLVRLTASETVLMKSALQKQNLGASATAEFEIWGIAPRLPMQLSFKPKTLLSDIVAHNQNSRLIGQAALVNYLKTNLQNSKFSLSGQTQRLKEEEMAQALAGLVYAHFGKLAPAPTNTAGPHLQLNDPTTAAEHQFSWDFENPLVTPKAMTLTLDPIEAARQLLQKNNNDVESLICRSTIPPISTGHKRVTMALTNLPPNLTGVLDLGVNIRVEAQMAPPRDAQLKSWSQQELLKTRSERPQKVLRFAPGEQIEYTFQTTAVFKNGRFPKQAKGEMKSATKDILYLRPSHFPIAFVPFKATPSLLKMAAITGVVTRPGRKKPIKHAFELTEEKPVVTVTMPKEALHEATVELEAHERGGKKIVKLGPLPADNITQIEPYSFREFGPQHVDVVCRFESDKTFVVYEFLPEGKAELQTLHFTKSDSKKRLTWLSASLFQYRYQYRLKADAGAAANPWSDFCEPFKSLTLTV